MTDIRVGDLIRATNKKYPETTVTARVTYVSTYGNGYDVLGNGGLRPSEWTFEVLDRPLPKVEDDLLDKVIDIYRKLRGYEGPVGEIDKKCYIRDLTPVINAVREYDNRDKEEGTK